MATISPAIWGIPPVRSSNERDLLFPNPATNQRVHNVTSRTIERWTGTAWVRESFGSAVDVRDFGAVGDGVTDDTAAMQDAFDAGMGGAVNIPRGFTFLASATLNLASATHYYGGGCVKLADGADIGFGTAGLGKGLLHGADCVGTFVEDIEVDGNGDATSTKCHAIVFEGGEWNTVKKCRPHDTYHAGIEGINTDYFDASDNTVLDCGRGGTNDHGIMLVSTLGGMKNPKAKLNTVNGTNRKGIASYAQSPGYFAGMNVSLNDVSESGLGDIYLGAVPGSRVENLTCIGNTCKGSPINLELDNVWKGVVALNNCAETSNDCNIHLYGCKDVLVSTNTLDKAFFHAIMLNIGLGDGCTGCKVEDNIITRPNQGAFGSGAGIALENSTDNTVKGNSITDEDGNIIYCILEDAGCDDNVIENNPILEDFATSRVLITGANTRWDASTGLNRGIGVVAPTKAMDVGVDFNIGGREFSPSQPLVLTTGDNNDVALTAGTVFTPTAGGGAPLGGNYAITGLTGGEEGRRIVLFNFSTYTMTIKHASTGSLVANRIYVGGSADLPISQYGSVTLVYSESAIGGDGGWAVEAYKA